MGFFDTLKSAVNAVTGGAATVTLQYEPQVVTPGGTVNVRITATSTGQEVKSQGAFIDLFGSETVQLPAAAGQPPASAPPAQTATTSQQEILISPPFVLAANETKTFEGRVQLPANCLPSYQGKFAKHNWQIRGRIAAFGSDPDSGYMPLRVGSA